MIEFVVDVRIHLHQWQSPQLLLLFLFLLLHLHLHLPLYWYLCYHWNSDQASLLDASWSSFVPIVAVPTPFVAWHFPQASCNRISKTCLPSFAVLVTDQHLHYAQTGYVAMYGRGMRHSFWDYACVRSKDYLPIESLPIHGLDQSWHVCSIK